MTDCFRKLRRDFMICMVLCVLGPGFAMAENAYPSRPIHMVVPFPPGGSTDALGRQLAQEMAVELGQSVIVENKAGASGNIGAIQVARSSPDGYTLLLVSGAFVVNPSLGAQYDVKQDFSPITYVATVPSVLVVNPSVPARTLPELVALIKNSPPNSFNFATPGTGSVQHLAGELLKREADINLTHVPYSGAGPAIAAVLGNHVQMAIVSVPSIRSQIEAGGARAIATTLSERVSMLPETPTFVEAGYPSIIVDQIQGLLAPAGVPSDVIEKLNSTLVSIIHKPEITQTLLEQGYVPLGTTSTEFANELEIHGKKWAEVIKDGNIRTED